MLQMFVSSLSLYNIKNQGVFLLCKITNLLIYSSLDIFNTFYIIFFDKTHKKQIVQQLSDWKIKIAFDDEFMPKREYKRVLEEKIQMREERKKLYEESKKRKR